MPRRAGFSEDVRRLVVEHVHSIGALDLLMLMRDDAERWWTVDDVCDALRCPPRWAAVHLGGLRAVRADGIACAILLLRGWARAGAPLLLSSGVCFAGLAANTVLLFLDLSVVTNVDLRWARLTALVGLLALLYGLVWQTGSRE